MQSYINHKDEDNMNYKTEWQARQKELEDKYVELMLAKYPLLTDVTTNTQRKNGTRMFELNHKKYGPTRFATYKTGMVRKIIRTRFGRVRSCYQLNPQRKTTKYYAYLSDNSELNIRSYEGIQRVGISSGLARLVYLEKYLIKNYNLDSVQDIIEHNGILYQRIN